MFQKPCALGGSRSAGLEVPLLCVHAHEELDVWLTGGFPSSRLTWIYLKYNTLLGIITVCFTDEWIADGQDGVICDRHVGYIYFIFSNC